MKFSFIALILLATTAFSAYAKFETVLSCTDGVTVQQDGAGSFFVNTPGGRTPVSFQYKDGESVDIYQGKQFWVTLHYKTATWIDSGTVTWNGTNSLNCR